MANPVLAKLLAGFPELTGFQCSFSAHGELTAKINKLVLACSYCKTLYFRCILISQFWNVEISLHFNLAFSQCSISIYQACDGQTEFSWVFNFAILYYSRNSRKFDAHEKYMFYSI